MLLAECFHKSDKLNNASPVKMQKRGTESSPFSLEIPLTVEVFESEQVSAKQQEFSWLLLNASDNKMRCKYLRFFF
jgi:hypothetical protein